MKIENEIKQQQFLAPHHKAGINIIFTANWLLNEIAIALKPVGLSLQQLNALSILDGQPNKTATVNLIRERLIDRMPNVSRLLNKLMEKGFIVKERNLTDQRIVYIKLTPKGVEVKQKGRELFDKIGFKIDNEQAELLNSLLDEMRE
ncbi:MarR family winged helix-turn-helix transcriptional regulator [Mucilaginibacter sp.]